MLVLTNKKRAEVRRRVVKYKNPSPWLFFNTNLILLKFADMKKQRYKFFQLFELP